MTRSASHTCSSGKTWRPRWPSWPRALPPIARPAGFLPCPTRPEARCAPRKSPPGSGRLARLHGHERDGEGPRLLVDGRELFPDERLPLVLELLQLARVLGVHLAHGGGGPSVSPVGPRVEGGARPVQAGCPGSVSGGA